VTSHLTLCNIWACAASLTSAYGRAAHLPSSQGEGHGGEAPALFHVVRSLPPLLIDNRWHLIWRRSNSQSIFVLPIRRTICCCPARRSLNLISYSRNQVLIVHLTCRLRVMAFLVRWEGCRLEAGCRGDEWMDTWCRLWKSVSLTEAVSHQGMCWRIASRQYTAALLSAAESYWQVTKKMPDFEKWGRDLHQHCNDFSESSLIWEIPISNWTSASNGGIMWHLCF